MVLYKSYCCTNQPVVGISRLTIRGIAKDLLSLASADPSALPCLGEEAEFVCACSSWEQISCQHHSREEVGRQEKRYSLLNKISLCLKAANSESRTCMSKLLECVWSLIAGGIGGFRTSKLCSRWRCCIRTEHRCG